MLHTDYLVIGAGAVSLAFIDTLLDEQPAANIIIVDKHESPGGHWNDAYGFVRLHQPSLLYGVASKQMEGNWAKLLLKGTLPWTHRASKGEILAYYQALVDKWVASGQVSYFPKCIYDFEKSCTENDIHCFSTLDGSQKYNVKVQVKLVNGILGECRVPSTTPPAFAVDDSVTMLTPNQVYETLDKVSSSWSIFSSRVAANKEKYVVLGGGKTAMDTVLYLQRNGIDASDISWVIPNDVWMLRRTSAGSPWSWGEALLEKNLDANAAAIHLEDKGIFTRLDPNVMPTKFRFPVVGDEEMKLMRNIHNVIRRGRVTCIREGARVSFDRGEDVHFASDSIFVHCTSPGPFNGNAKNTDIFPNDKTINLSMLYAPPVPLSLSCIAILEGRRRNGSLDLEFGRKLCKCIDDKNDFTDNDVLEKLITGYNITAKDDVSVHPADQVAPLKTLACFIAILDEDPITAYKWLSGNRLSFFSIPGFKGHVYETIVTMVEKQETLQLSENEVKMLSLLVEKLKPLEGK